MTPRKPRRPRHSRTLSYDPTFGDLPLARALQDLRIGRWQGARDLLRATGHDWDRRTHRVRRLAETAAGSRTVESWQIAEPHNPDAFVLRSDTEVMRLFYARAAEHPDAFDHERLHHTVQACIRASSRFPADPMPWISLVTLARLAPGGHPHTWYWWEELLSRDRYSREGHHQVLRHLSAHWHGSHGRMYDFARDVATAAPLGSPLAVLTQAARAEHYREVIRTEGKEAVGLSFHWTHDALAHDLDTTLNRWIAHRGPIKYAQDVADLNLLAHALVFAGRTQDAAVVFRHLGDRPTVVPWAYCGDSQALFIRWRNELLP